MAKNKDQKREDAPVVDSGSAEETQPSLDVAFDEVPIVEDATVVEKTEDKSKDTGLNPKAKYAVIGIKKDKNIKEGKEYQVSGTVASILIKRGLVKLK